MLWILFIILTTIILLSGKNLVKYGDILAEKLNLGRTIVGIVLVASITSLPELITGISAVTYADSPNIAAGEIYGSCMFNLLILALIDAFVREKPITTKVHHGLTISATFGIIIITSSALAIFLGNKIPMLGWISYASFFITILYIFAIWTTTNYERRLIVREGKDRTKQLEYDHISLKETVIKYSMNAIVIVFTSAFLPKVGKAIAYEYDMTETFFGTFFIALSTSLPEISVSLIAVKMNMITISVANLLGSNLFNVFILAINDLFYTKGSLFSFIDRENIFSAGIAVIMTAIVIIGLIYRAEKKMFLLAYESLALISVYLTGIIVLYVL